MNLDTARTFALDVAERAANAAWQGAAGAAGPILIAANATDVARAAWWLQALAIAAAGAVSALGSLAKGVAAGVKTGTASLSTTVAQTAVLPGAHASDYPNSVATTSSAELGAQPAAASSAPPAIAPAPAGITFTTSPQES